MSLLPGARIAGYEILGAIGAGGMGEVYRARDTRLQRDVAIKILPPGFAADPERVARFTREAQTLAALNHQNIAHIHGLEDSGGLVALVMELVEGDDLSTRLARGAVPLDEALPIARQIAAALEAAHDRGIVHRDLKPANIKIRPDGAVKILDFGLAKTLDAVGARASSDAETMASPVERRARQGDGPRTEAGMILGTAGYMSPEQARGLVVDRRSDIWAFGAVLYEMLTGRPAFTGATVTDLVAAVLRDDVDWSLLPAATPSSIRDLLARCLVRDLRTRLQAIGEARVVLEGALTTPASGRSSAAAAIVVSPGGAVGKRVFAIAAGVALLAAGGVGLWMLGRRQGVTPPTSTEMTLAVLPIQNLGGDSNAEYLADGMTGELSHALSRLPGMQVVGDISTFRFKGAQKQPAEIAHELGVRLLLTGKLQPGPGRIRLQMQLIDRDGKLLWSNTFDRDNKDSFAIQDEITAAIASEMRVVLSPVAVADARAGRTMNSEAHDLYLRGQFEKNKLTPEGLTRALAYFQDALKLDPNYAQAHAGVAFAYDLLADVYKPSHEYHVLSLAAAERAVALDSHLAEARVLHGYEIAAATWDFAAGREEMARGLEMNPQSPDGLFMFGMFRYLSGDTNEAVALADRLTQVDPLSPIAARLRAEALAWGGRYQEALDQDTIATKLDPNVLIWETTRGISLREMGRLGEAAAAFLDYQRSAQQPSVGLAVTYSRMGRQADALAIIHAIEARERLEWVDPDFLAIAYAGIGDRDRAMTWLETAFRKKTFSLRAFLNWDVPWLKSLREDPRFIALKRRVLETTFKE